MFFQNVRSKEVFKGYLLFVLLVSFMMAFGGCKKKEEAKAPTPEALQQAKAHYDEGVKHTLTGEYDKAIEEYKKSLELNPASPEAYNNLGFAYFDKGDIDNAIESHRKAAELDPQFANAHYGLAQAFEAKGDKKGALESWKKFVELSGPGKWRDLAEERVKALEQEVAGS